MSDLFASGRIFDVIIALTALEGIGLLIWHRATGRGLAPLDILGNLAAGAFLLLAARLALSGAWYGWTGLSLAAAGVSHAADLRRRLVA